jgi:hypothetical protein
MQVNQAFYGSIRKGDNFLRQLRLILERLASHNTQRVGAQDAPSA